jgi:hypothetical protein
MSQEVDGKGCRKERRRERRDEHTVRGRGAKQGRRCDGKRRKTTAMPITAREDQTNFTLIFHSPNEKKNKLS